MNGADLPAVILDLARAKAVFQQRAIVAAMGLNPSAHVPGCRACGRFDCTHPDPVFAGIAPTSEVR